jgi:glucan phosphoethanolaminetransferase (alkaline phosphatase superfamily)
VILKSGSGTPDYGVYWYAALAYGGIFGTIGAGMGLFSALSGRLMQREALTESLAFARLAAGLLAGSALAITAFRIRRDYYHEELKWMSGKGLGVLAGCIVGAIVLYLVVATVLRLLSSGRAGRVLLAPWFVPAVFVLVVGPLYGFAKSQPSPHALPTITARKAAPANAGNVLFIVVDTLRADHLPLYGYAKGKTPNLDAFAQDAIRFENAFSNASWTRPSSPPCPRRCATRASARTAWSRTTTSRRSSISIRASITTGTSSRRSCSARTTRPRSSCSSSSRARRSRRRAPRAARSSPAARTKTPAS